MGQGHFLQDHLVRHKFFFMIFFVLVCFQDEVKQLSNGKFFIGIGLVIGLAMTFLIEKTVGTFQGCSGL